MPIHIPNDILHPLFVGLVLIVITVTLLFLKEYAILHIASRMSWNAAAKNYQQIFGDDDVEQSFDDHVETTPGMQYAS